MNDEISVFKFTDEDCDTLINHVAELTRTPQEGVALICATLLEMGRRYGTNDSTPEERVEHLIETLRSAYTIPQVRQ